MKQTFLIETTVFLLIIAFIFARNVSSSQWSWDFNSPVPTFDYSRPMSFNISIYAPLDLSITIDKNLLNPIVVRAMSDVYIPARSASDTDFNMTIPAFSSFYPCWSYNEHCYGLVLFDLMDMANTTVLNSTFLNYDPSFGVIPANLNAGENSTILAVTTSTVPSLTFSITFAEAENASSFPSFHIEGLYLAPTFATFDVWPLPLMARVVSPGRPLAFTVSTSSTDIIKSNSSGKRYPQKAKTISLKIKNRCYSFDPHAIKIFYLLPFSQ